MEEVRSKEEERAGAVDGDDCGSAVEPVAALSVLLPLLPVLLVEPAELAELPIVRLELMELAELAELGIVRLDELALLPTLSLLLPLPLLLELEELALVPAFPLLLLLLSLARAVGAVSKQHSTSAANSSTEQRNEQPAAMTPLVVSRAGRGVHRRGMQRRRAEMQ